MKKAIVVYDIQTKKIVGLSKSTAKDIIEWDDIKDFYTPNEKYDWIQIGHEEFDSIEKNKDLFLINDDNKLDKKFIQQCKKNILMKPTSLSLIESNDQYLKYLITNDYIKNNIDILINFEYSDQTIFNPIGDIILKTNIGKLSWKKQKLDGTKNSISFSIKQPKENSADIIITAKITPNWDNSYGIFKLILESET